jgi:hypothetical protein
MKVVLFVPACICLEPSEIWIQIWALHILALHILALHCCSRAAHLQGQK